MHVRCFPNRGSSNVQVGSRAKRREEGKKKKKKEGKERKKKEKPENKIKKGGGRK